MAFKSFSSIGLPFCLPMDIRKKSIAVIKYIQKFICICNYHVENQVYNSYTRVSGIMSNTRI